MNMIIFIVHSESFSIIVCKRPNFQFRVVFPSKCTQKIIRIAQNVFRGSLLNRPVCQANYLWSHDFKFCINKEDIRGIHFIQNMKNIFHFQAVDSLWPITYAYVHHVVKRSLKCDWPLRVVVSNVRWTSKQAARRANSDALQEVDRNHIQN